MAKLLDQVIIIDLEATCWEDGNHNRKDGQVSEIIEVGVCAVDVNNFCVMKTQSIIVKPQKSKVSDFCTKLTTLTQSDVDKGVSFKEACDILRKEYKTDLRTWASWGDYDRTQFDRECSFKRIRPPFGRTHINIKNVFAIMNGLKREISVGEALEMKGRKFDGTPHRGMDDAVNIASLFIDMLHLFDS